MDIYIQAASTFPHSPTIYGSRVETDGPYPQKYMKVIDIRFFDTLIITTLKENCQHQNRTFYKPYIFIVRLFGLISLQT